MSNYFDHPDYIALRNNVLLNAHDDAPRLVLADWIEEHGDENRAEYIRAAIGVDRCPIRTTVCPIDLHDIDFEKMGVSDRWEMRSAMSACDLLVLKSFRGSKDIPLFVNEDRNYIFEIYHNEYLRNNHSERPLATTKAMRFTSSHSQNTRLAFLEKDERPEWIKVQQDRATKEKYRTFVDQGSSATMIEDECRQFTLKHLLPPASHRIDPQAYFVYKRGFPERFVCLMEFFVQHHKTMFESMPLSEVEIRDATPSRAGGRATWNSTESTQYYLSGTLIPMFLFRHMNQGYGSDLHGRTYPTVESANKALQDAIETYRICSLTSEPTKAKEYTASHFMWWTRQGEIDSLLSDYSWVPVYDQPPKLSGLQSAFIRRNLHRQNLIRINFQPNSASPFRLQHHSPESRRSVGGSQTPTRPTIVELSIERSPLTLTLAQDYQAVILPASELPNIIDLPGIITDLNGKRI